MKLFLNAILLVTALCLGSSVRAAEDTDHEGMQVSVPSKMQWNDMPSLPPGAKMAVLHGDPMKPGSFTMRIKFSGNWQVPPHTHPVDENVTVLSGSLHIGHGERFDKTSAQEIPAGGYYSMPAKMPHYAWVDEDTEIQIHGMGPWGIMYINPTDDPRK